MDKNSKLNLLSLSSVGITLVAATVIGFISGYYLDKLLKTAPVFTLIMLLVGIIAGFWSIFKEVRKFKDHADK